MDRDGVGERCIVGELSSRVQDARDPAAAQPLARPSTLTVSALHREVLAFALPCQGAFGPLAGRGGWQNR